MIQIWDCGINKAGETQKRDYKILGTDQIYAEHTILGTILQPFI